MRCLVINEIGISTKSALHTLLSILKAIKIKLKQWQRNLYYLLVK
jgi:hypothetical protein